VDCFSRIADFFVGVRWFFLFRAFCPLRCSSSSGFGYSRCYCGRLFSLFSGGNVSRLRLADTPFFFLFRG